MLSIDRLCIGDICCRPSLIKIFDMGPITLYDFIMLQSPQTKILATPIVFEQVDM